MKKLILSLLALFAVQFTNAQEGMAEEIALLQDLFGAEKRTIIEQNIDLTGVNTEAFWKLYDEYEQQRQEIGQERITLLQSYTTKQGALTDQQAADLLKKAVPIRTAEDKLILNYTKRIGKATNNLVSVQFYQIEHYISDGIRFAILNNIDFIQDKK